MSQFTLAFPVYVEMDEIFSVTEDVEIATDTKTVMIPGCSLKFEVDRQPPSPDEFFEKFLDTCVFGITPDEEDEIVNHESLILLRGNVKSIEDVRMVNVAILKMLDAGAIGVGMHEAGLAWTAEVFRGLDIGDRPMYPWIGGRLTADNMVYTLGLAVFALPDLCTSYLAEVSSELLNKVAYALFVDGVPAKAGSVIDFGDGERYELCQELNEKLNRRYSEDAPENKLGLLRVVKK